MPGKILIVDGVATNRIVLKVKLAAARYDTCQAATGAAALTLAQTDRPDLILLDLDLPDGNGPDLCRHLKADPATRAIPLVAVAQTPAERIAALRAGAEEVMAKPLDEMLLLARLRSLLRARETEEELRLREATCRDLGFAEPAAAFRVPVRVTLVSPTREASLGWKQALTPHLPGVELTLASHDEALTQSEERAPPDAILIAVDPHHPGDGLRLLSELRSRPATRHAVICMALPDAPRETAAIALDLGANDLLPAALAKPEAAEEAALRLRQHLARKRIADRQRSSVADGLRLAVTDPLTGLFNRRYALPHLARVTAHAGQTGRPFAVLALDLDRFKAVNDSWGHAAGDAVLTETARRLRTHLRETDLAARIGGEEFLIVLPDTTPEAARALANRLCAAIRQQPVTLPDGAGEIRVTMSIGVAIGLGLPDQSAEALLDQADRALLASKAGGRNQVRLAARASAA